MNEFIRARRRDVQSPPRFPSRTPTTNISKISTARCPSSTRWPAANRTTCPDPSRPLLPLAETRAPSDKATLSASCHPPFKSRKWVWLHRGHRPPVRAPCRPSRQPELSLWVGGAAAIVVAHDQMTASVIERPRLTAVIRRQLPSFTDLVLSSVACARMAR